MNYKKGSLKKHTIEVHEGQKDYKCESCGKSYSRAESLKNHIHQVHEGHKDLHMVNHFLEKEHWSFTSIQFTMVIKITNVILVANHSLHCKFWSDISTLFMMVIKIKNMDLVVKSSIKLIQKIWTNTFKKFTKIRMNNLHFSISKCRFQDRSFRSTDLKHNRSF